MAKTLNTGVSDCILLKVQVLSLFLFGTVSVRSISMPALIQGGGVLHSKLLVADRRHFYVGSANLSDRGLTKTKEMGLLVTNCPTLAEDAAKLFEVYWHMGGTNRIPKSWPSSYR